MWPVWDCIRNSAYMHTIPLHFCGHLCVEINQPQTLYAPPAIMGTSIGNTSRTLDSMPKLYAHGHPSTRFLANLAGWPYFVITSPAKPQSSCPIPIPILMPIPMPFPIPISMPSHTPKKIVHLEATQLCGRSFIRQTKIVGFGGKNYDSFIGDRSCQIAGKD